VYGADEAFVTGTFAGIVPVREIDGRTIGDSESRPVMQRLRTLYQAAIERDVTEAARR
jgi:branched-chain amino acid aminotransferase